MVNYIKLPITTVVKGRRTSALVPTFIAIGTNPKLATSIVIKTGLSRVSDPSTIELTNLTVSNNRCLINDNITNPLSTAIPESTINPAPADIDNGKSLSLSAKIPPVKASGTSVNIIKASLTEPNAITNKAKVINNVAGTTIDNH
jgi:hypothetical protein